MRRSTRLQESLPESLTEEPLVGRILRGMLWKVMCAPASSVLLQHTSAYVSICQRIEVYAVMCAPASSDAACLSDGARARERACERARGERERERECCEGARVGVVGRLCLYCLPLPLLPASASTACLCLCLYVVGLPLQLLRVVGV